MYPSFDQFEQTNFQVNVLINSTQLKSSAPCLNRHKKYLGTYETNKYPKFQLDMTEIKQKFGNRMYLQPNNQQIFKGSHMQEISKLFKKFNQIYLFYIGHAYQNGDWAIQVGEKSVGRITLAQIAEIWGKERKDANSSRLFILMDSCYAGGWSHTLSSSQQISMAGITIYAAFDHNETSNQKNSGLFFKCLLEDDKIFQANYKKLTDNSNQPLRIEQGHQPLRISKKQIITLFNIIRKSYNWVVTSPKKQQNLTYRSKLPGLILQAQCNNPECNEAYGKLIYFNCGMGVFNVGKQLFQAHCPICRQRTKRAIALHCYKTNVSLEGIIDTNGKEHTGHLSATDNDGVSTIFDAANELDQWSFLQVVTKPL